MALHPLESLSVEDKEFVLRFVLASGSLKDVAQAYGVSYPTLRTRLDQLIARLNEIAAGRTPDPMAELIASMVDRGQLGTKEAMRLLTTHRQSLAQTKEEQRG
ncbi:DUF2089 family protein [Botrimarina hoheduenensis]|uniref:DUF2089 domain-containing protein n=1 Tax=Botrimarina hoheduenensis TaxID=2528000 RepID=A0A5C5W6X3_9BACT|nr:DUF2089 family protein [Botrimarina hoheduenensis]TWT46636.1 hypothetical protein Pla111_17370 [Botrimarina hoheduenensis]